MRFLYNAPALYHKGALIIGDTHFGIEERLEKEGIHSKDFSEKVLENLLKLLKKTKAKKLIILGDVKENITYIDDTTRSILKKLERITEVIISKGNHDGGIEEICSNVKSASGFVYEGLGLIHGNAWPDESLMQCEHLIMAHQHPMVEFADAFGKKHFQSAWLILDPNTSEIKSRYKNFNRKIKLILMPAFNPLAGKSIKLNASGQLGPLLNNDLFDLRRAIVYGLDGAYLGRLKNLI